MSTHVHVQETPLAAPEALHVVLLPLGEGQPVEEDGQPQAALDAALLLAEVHHLGQTQCLGQPLDVPA